MSQGLLEFGDSSTAKDYFRVRLSSRMQLAVPISHVQTTAQFNPHQICVIPGMPVCLQGVVNRRGVLLWVLDLNQFLDLPPFAFSPGKAFTTILLRSHAKSHQEESTQSIACLVTQLEGNLSRPLEPLPKPLKPRLQPLFPGVIYLSRSPIPVIDVDVLLHTLYQEVFAHLNSLRGISLSASVPSNNLSLTAS